MRIKPQLVLINVIIIVILIYSCNVSSNEIELTSIREGEALFSRNCQSCHSLNSAISIKDIKIKNKDYRSLFLNMSDTLHSYLIKSLTDSELINLNHYIEFEKENIAKP